MVTLVVSEVREKLFRAQGVQAGPGSSSSVKLGTMFHRIMSELLRAESAASVERALVRVDPDLPTWKSHLVRHAYDELLGPLLTRERGVLAGQGREVLDLWQAMQEACEWLCELWWEYTRQGRQGTRQEQWFCAEKRVEREFMRSGWKEPVRLVGQIDAELRHPTTERWCLLEFKLGQANPVLDLAQLALYDLLLHGEDQDRAGSMLSLVSFRPERHEIGFESARVWDAQQRLIEVLGQIAGVVPEHVIPPPPPRKVSEHETGGGVEKRWLQETQLQILRALRQVGVGCREGGEPSVGPAFVRFYVIPERGIAPRKVLSQEEQLQLALRLIVPPNMALGEGRIGIDVPRERRESVPFSRMRRELAEIDAQAGNARVPVGMKLTGEWQWLDFASSESAHALVVGTPGSGKSQWLRAMVAALLCTNTPETLQLALIDPKQNAFGFCRRSPYLRRPILYPGRTDEPVSDVLREITHELQDRNERLAESNSQSLVEHVRKTGERMPRIVLVCDEYADLLDGAEKVERKEIEQQLKRIAQVGRSAGVHLVLATQQPRANVLTTSIRSLIPAKVSLRVSSKAESRIALEEDGAERLLGNGDLLYRCVGATQRLQGAWLPEAEERLVGADRSGAETRGACDGDRDR